MRKEKSYLSTVAVLFASVLFVLGTVVIFTGCFTNESSVFYYQSGYTSVEYEQAREEIEQYAQANGLSINQWPKEVIELLSNNSETRDFVLNYPTLKDKDVSIDISDSLNSDSLPLFLQWDQRWGYASYGDDIIAISGCGPTSLSMVASYLLHDSSLNPKTVSDFSETHGYCVPGNGSAWSLISEGGQQLGLDVKELPLDENIIISNLEEDKPIICVMGPGDFTSSGHYIVMTEYINGKIKINDPNSKMRSEKLWDYSQIESQIDNLWACSVPSL